MAVRVPARLTAREGRKFGLTRERIRQIQEIALKKLRKKIEKMEQQRKAA